MPFSFLSSPFSLPFSDAKQQQQQQQQQQHRKAVDDLLSDDQEPWVSHASGYADVSDDHVVNDAMRMMTTTKSSSKSTAGTTDTTSTTSSSNSSNSSRLEDYNDDSKTTQEQLSLLEDDQKRQPATYGEVTTCGARQLFCHMGMTGMYNGKNKNTVTTTTTTTSGVPDVEDTSASTSTLVHEDVQDIFHGADDSDIGIDIDDEETDSDNHVVFYDLGSGRGKLVLQAYMELSRVRKSVGIELGPQRHASAISAWDDLKPKIHRLRRENHNDINNNAATVELLEGDFLHADLSQVTHMYLSSLAYPDDLMHRIATKLQRESPPHLQCIATLRPFPEGFQTRGVLDSTSFQVVWKTFGLTHRVEYVEMTWTQRRGTGCAVHVYTKMPSFRPMASVDDCDLLVE